jgi:hypothetical protein
VRLRDLEHVAQFVGERGDDFVVGPAHASRDTVMRDWKVAKLWLLRELKGGRRDR